MEILSQLADDTVMLKKPLYNLVKLKDACSLEKSYDQPRQVIKQDITLPIKLHLVKVMVFPVVMYGYESWTIKKDEH